MAAALIAMFALVLPADAYGSATPALRGAGSATVLVRAVHEYNSPGSGDAGAFGGLSSAPTPDTATPSPTKSTPGHSLAGRGVSGLVLLLVLAGAWWISRTVHQRRVERRRREQRNGRDERDERYPPPDDWDQPGGA